jgi:hypothetical protein
MLNKIENEPFLFIILEVVSLELYTSSRLKPQQLPPSTNFKTTSCLLKRQQFSQSGDLRDEQRSKPVVSMEPSMSSQPLMF